MMTIKAKFIRCQINGGVCVCVSCKRMNTQRCFSNIYKLRPQSMYTLKQWI